MSIHVGQKYCRGGETREWSVNSFSVEGERLVAVDLVDGAFTMRVDGEDFTARWRRAGAPAVPTLAITLDVAITELAVAREHQWAALRALESIAGAYQQAGVDVRETTKRVAKLQEQIVNHISHTTRPDGDDPGAINGKSLAVSEMAVEAAARQLQTAKDASGMLILNLGGT